MTPTVYPRAAWTDTPRPVAQLALNDPRRLRGVAVHYTGSTTPLGSDPSLAQTCALLEQERSYHVNGHGWTDIAYLAACDQAGRLFDCRGIDYECAANGDQDVNHAYGAITWLGGAGDIPTPAAVESIRWWRANVWLPRWPHATAVVGHRDLYSTDCPSDAMYAYVRSGAFTADQPQEDNVPLTPAEIEAVATRTRDMILAVTYGTKADGSPHTLGNVIGETLTGVLALQQHGVPVTFPTDQVPVLAQAIAAQVVPHLSPGADPQAIATAVCDLFVTRLKS